MPDNDASAVLEQDDSAMLSPAVSATPGPTPSALNPLIAALCQPISADDPCGPDLDFAGDAAYLNYFAGVEGVLPSSFFSAEDGKPFDRMSVDLPGQIAAIEPLMQRTRDLRLIVTRARLMILNRDLKGFVTSIAAAAEMLDLYWDAVHPRLENGDVIARQSALAALELPTVVFALQYTPLFEFRRIGAISYRAWMIANGDAKARTGEPTLNAANIVAAKTDADAAILSAVRTDVVLMKTSLDRIRAAFAQQGASAGLDNLPALADKILMFIDPRSVESSVDAASDDSDPDTSRGPSLSFGSTGNSLADARDALAAIADYYAVSEPSSPTLPLVRQAHLLVGKSFFEVMSVLVPTQLEKAAFSIGGDQVFDLPLGKLPKPSELTMPPVSAIDGAEVSRSALDIDTSKRRHCVESRAQAIALLEQVERHFRRTEPSSPVPWLCERARALAERDFMAVLRDVLPKAALRNIGSDK